jgi:hypothetical protein
MEHDAEARAARVGRLVAALEERGRATLRTAERRVGSAARGALALLGAILVVGIAAVVLRLTNRPHALGYHLERWIDGK